MKIVLPAILLISIAFITGTAAAQNASINILTQNAGIVKKHKSVFLEVTVNNTDVTANIGIYKLKTQVSLPDSAVVRIQEAGHSLPTGWKIISCQGNTITLSNGKDIIAPNDARTILVALEGVKTGGPVSISGQLFFSNGTDPGTDPGSLLGDNPADNNSTTSCSVIK